MENTNYEEINQPETTMAEAEPTMKEPRKWRDFINAFSGMAVVATAIAAAAIELVNLIRYLFFTGQKLGDAFNPSTLASIPASLTHSWFHYPAVIAAIISLTAMAVWYLCDTTEKKGARGKIIAMSIAFSVLAVCIAFIETEIYLVNTRKVYFFAYSFFQMNVRYAELIALVDIVFISIMYLIEKTYQIHYLIAAAGFVWTMFSSVILSVVLYLLMFAIVLFTIKFILSCLASGSSGPTEHVFTLDDGRSGKAYFDD